MKDTVQVHCINTNEKKDVPMGSSLEELIEVFGVKMPHLIANAKVNNKTESLAYRIYRPKRIEYVDISNSSAMRTYVRSLCFILAKAVDDLFPDAQIFIEHSVSNGYYFQIDAGQIIGKEQLDNIRNRMREIVDADIPFESIEDETTNVVKLFREHRMEDKALLLETSDFLYAYYFKLGNYIDYYYGCIVPSTGYIQLFDIQQYNGGFLLQVPSRTEPEQLAPIVKQEKLLNVYREHLKFLKISDLNNVGDLNKAKINGRISDVIQISEAYQAKQIGEIAAQIRQKYDEGVRLILISGPSSSGKTTFRKRL